MSSAKSFVTDSVYLVIFYINDITKYTESVTKLFADDTSASLALKDPHRRVAILNSDLEKINSWEKQWKLVLMKKN